ncbi:trypsin-like peptidase domain-containing protein [Mesobacillus foraminis]|uniref:Trypsin-like peptidase n=1 Tax=Mesobacillus foraminis TaxID=279826 RepID=A0A4R2BD06_9BACI|nr:trypsin-like peptidase domain-containing protein [Mesobacillus foraminis]TCN24828.1 trypsin-like peptidase [Mesobacillus foraminis]
MFCPNCGGQLNQRARACSTCGQRLYQKYTGKWLASLFIITLVLCVGLFSFLYGKLTLPNQTQQTVKLATEPEPVKQTTVKLVETRTKLTEIESKDVSDIIQGAQPKVYTIINDFGQGSGFLMNNNGDILTNAHVVEGSIHVTIRNHQGTEYKGTVIGYSNEVDIAVIRVPDLAGNEPLILETVKESNLGDEIIALGTPRGFENTATLGNISGVNRSFVIEPHTYDGIYQISAPIAPGSSGGPLLDKNTEKVIAINSARHTQETNIGFSIPIFKVIEIVNRWVSSPMSEEEISNLFYNHTGQFFYQDLYDSEHYFDGGDYAEEYEEYYFYEEPYTESTDDSIDGDMYEEEYDEEDLYGGYEEDIYEEEYYDEDDGQEEYIEEYYDEEDEYTDEYFEDEDEAETSEENSYDDELNEDSTDNANEDNETENSGEIGEEPIDTSGDDSELEDSESSLEDLTEE